MHCRLKIPQLMNRLTILLITLCSLIAGRAQNGIKGEWRLHNSWDYYATKTIDTPERTFFQMKGQYLGGSNTAGWSENSNLLFVYDKEDGSLSGYNAANYLHGNIIQFMEYNSRKGYLLIVYEDSSIDLLYDDDTIYTVPGLSTAVLNASKKVTAASFDADNGRIYLASEFGYLVIDDTKHVIDGFYNYNRPLTGIGRVGDNLVASCADGIFISPLSSRHNDWSSFTPLRGVSGAVSGLIALNSTQFAYFQSGCHLATLGDAGTVETKQLFTDNVRYASECKDGYYLQTGWWHNLLDRQGKLTRSFVPTDLRENQAGTWDFVDYYYERGRDGIEARRYNASDQSWSQGVKVPSPFPQPYRIFHITHSPEYGMIMANESFNRFLQPYWVNNRFMASCYKDGEWTNAGGLQNPSSPFAESFRNGYGCVIDPLDPNVIWSGSYNGLYSLHLPDNALELYSYPDGPGNGKPGFHPVFVDVFDGSVHKAHVGAPSFDPDGNLWVMENMGSLTTASLSPLYCWPVADRRTGNTASFKSITLKGYTMSPTYGSVEAMRHSSNRNTVIFYHPMQWGGPIYVLDHKGTLDNAADDKLVVINKFVDQNGNGIPSVYLNKLWEDPSTGIVWVGTSTGLFLFRPSEALSGKTNVTRIIIARNDGTNQGDYLLAGNDVLDINADGAGRKWISTNGNGVVVVSPSGDRIVEHFTAENSLLPSNQVYCTGFDPQSNAVWIGTQHHIATYYSDVTPGEPDYNNVLSYPNPVRPDFYGEVTIQGLMDDSLVKIIDQGGHLVKELGRSQGGMITWNLTNMQGERVSTGVYIIATSTEETGSAAVGKILVVK